MHFSSVFFRPLSLCLFFQLARAADSSDSLYIYTASSLGNISASADCITALTSNVTCYSGLSRAVTETSSWSEVALEKICTEACTGSLQDWVVEVDDLCGSGTYNLSGALQTASSAGDQLIWKQSAVCLVDDSSGEYCNIEFQDAAANGTGASTMACSQCYLDYLYTIADSEYGQGVISEQYFQDRASSCSATGYTLTYTATSSSTSAAATDASNARCNLTDADSTIYEVQSGDTCLSISAAQNVSTGLLASKNGLDPNCTYLTTAMSLCLPSACEIYMVQQNDTCDSITASLERKVNTQTFLSWNPNLNSICSNTASLVGTYVCISPPGTASIPDSFGLNPAMTAVAVPTNAVTTSNTDCGYWYTIQENDDCQNITNTYGISLDDFYFLNPQLNGSCASLWLGNAYCVEAVGSIYTYSGYSTTNSYTTLASALNTAATVTENRTTTHFFYSWPTITTMSEPYNSTIYSLISTYTLCDDAMDYYDIDEDDDLPEEAYDNDAWMSEYNRVCAVNPDAALPTVAFNTSIALDTVAATATTGASATASTASSTTTAPASTGLGVSPDGTCGSAAGYTCSGSQFGSCCSVYGFCGSTADYCVTYCDGTAGDCSAAPSASPTSSSSSAAPSPSSPVSPDGTCGGDAGYTCAGSQFGSCCSVYGFCGSSTDYCVTYCDGAHGECEVASASSTSSSSAASPTGSTSPDGSCGGDAGYTCSGSTFGDCCSIYGYCGSSSDYCTGSNCDSAHGTCS